MLTWRSLNQLQLLSDHLTLTRQPEKSHLYDKYGVPCSKVWLHFRSITQFDWCLTEVGSGGPRALQKVPKRALARVDPLKKGLLRVSALV